MSDREPLAADERIEYLDPRTLVAAKECQPRLTNRQDLIDDYAERMAAGDAFPPVRARFDGNAYYLSNGFHRRGAAIQARAASIPVRVRPGTLLDAIEDSCAANTDHGLRREPGDKRRAILAMLEVARQRGTDLQTKAIADHCGVTPQYVNDVRRSVAPRPEKQFPPGENGEHDPDLPVPAPFRANGEAPLADGVPGFSNGSAPGFVAAAGYAEPIATITEVVADLDPATSAALADRVRRDAVAAVVGRTIAEAVRVIARQREEVGQMLDDYGAEAIRLALGDDATLVGHWRDLIDLCDDFAGYLEGRGS